jgi:serine/threonine-protein kinase
LISLAQGGMGRVQVAVLRQDRFSRLFAIKRLHPHLAEDAEVRAMFVEEARVAGLIRHPNVVSVVTAGQDADGPYLVMEYVEGVAVSRLIESAQEDDRPLPLQLCVKVAAQAARGLHAAHEAVDMDGTALRLIHRDVSPQNILVGFDGVARVTDFGVAKLLDSTAHTRTGALKGRLGYMAPERLRFEKYDRRADLFALGVVLYEMLAGTRLYRAADGADAARRILHDPPPDVGLVREDVPAGVVQLVFELLAKRANLRPTTALETAERLEQALVSLAVREGPLDLERYVKDRFDSLQAEMSCRIRLALETPGPARRPRRWPWVAALTIGAVGGAGLFLQTAPKPAPVVPPQPAALPTTVTPPPSASSATPLAAASPPSPPPLRSAPVPRQGSGKRVRYWSW